MPPIATVAHEIDGRLRLKVPSRRNNQRYFEAGADVLRYCPGVESIVANPLTGSILILHHTSRAAIESYAESRGVFIVSSEPLAEVPAYRMASAMDSIGLYLDRMIADATRNTGDLRTITFLSLAAAAALQFLRGNGLPPGLTLLRYALGSLPAREPTREAEPGMGEAANGASAAPDRASLQRS